MYIVLINSLFESTELTVVGVTSGQVGLRYKKVD